MARVLIVHDEPQVHKILQSHLGEGQYVLSHASGVEEARLAIRNHQFEAILTNHKMADGDGLDILATARERDPHVSVVVLAATNTATISVDDRSRGLFDFLAQPFTPGITSAAVERACEHTALLRENSRLKAEVERLTASPAANHGTGNGHSNKFETGWIENLPPSFDLRALLATLEKSLIERTLQSTGGAQAEAARRLGLSRSDLSYKLLKYELRKETTAAS
jgi:DNA-binding NtrC family response regulator